jgi:hypothetical protein
VINFIALHFFLYNYFILSALVDDLHGLGILGGKDYICIVDPLRGFNSYYSHILYFVRVRTVPIYALLVAVCPLNPFGGMVGRS